MKKIVITLLLLMIPFIVKAADNEITIKSVEFVEKSPDASFVSEPTFSQNNVNFDVHFTKINDYLKYKIVIHNGTNEDYEIEAQSLSTDDKSFKYTTEILDNKKIVNSGEDITMVLSVSYDNLIDSTKFVNGVYSEKNNNSIVFTGQVINPITSTSSLLITIVLIVAIISLLIMLKISNKLKLSLILLLSFISIPLVTKALKKVTINVETKISINNEELCKFVTSKYSFDEYEDVQEIETLVVNDGYVYDALETYSIRDLSAPNGLTETETFFFAPYYRYNFNDNSYIKIYEDNTKANLITTINKDSFERLGYSLSSNDDTNKSIVIYLGIYNHNNIYVEASEDLQNINIPNWDIHTTDSSKTFNTPICYSLHWINQRSELVDFIRYDYEGPWIYDEDAVNKIEILSNAPRSRRLVDMNERLNGFIRKDNTNECIYEAQWGFYSVAE